MSLTFAALWAAGGVCTGLTTAYCGLLCGTSALMMGTRYGSEWTSLYQKGATRYLAATVVFGAVSVGCMGKAGCNVARFIRARRNHS